MSENYYDILGVSKKATEAEIKKAYRKLAIELHPDKHHGDKTAEEQFKKVNEAYCVLSNKDKKDEYDAKLAAEEKYASMRQTFGGNPGGGFNFNDFQSMFEAAFSSRPGSRFNHSYSNFKEEPTESNDVKIGVHITFEEAYTGTDKTLTYNVKMPCDKCDGTGYDKKSKMIKCPNCNGQGYTVVMNDAFFGERDKIKIKCKHCNGKGIRHKDTCHACNGHGYGVTKKTIRINIPAGSYTGAELRVKDYGSVSANGTAGNLFITITVDSTSKNGIFSRSDQDLIANIQMSYYDMLCGAEKELEFPDGTIKKFKIPAGIKPGNVIKLKGLGFKYLESGPNGITHGDVKINVELEQLSELTEEQRELLKTFNDAVHGIKNNNTKDDNNERKQN